jgi:NDP-sugar pyrophosphorylase family protein
MEKVKENKLDMVRSSENTEEVAFAGIHIISPRLIPMITESGTFSIIPVYLRLAELGEKIVGFRADESAWRDLGTPENVAEQDASSKEPRSTAARVVSGQRPVLPPRGHVDL